MSECAYGDACRNKAQMFCHLKHNSKSQQAETSTKDLVFHKVLTKKAPPEVILNQNGEGEEIENLKITIKVHQILM